MLTSAIASIFLWSASVTNTPDMIVQVNTNESLSVFNWASINTSLWLSAAAYCEASTYLNRTYIGYSTNFKATKALDVPTYDVQGFIGVMEDQQSIYVVFRGSTSTRDWINNIDTILTPYPNCTKCEVHAGFYRAEQSVQQAVVAEVQALRLQNPNFKVIVTGHSLGGALSTLSALTLSSSLNTSITLINFGSPRVGNLEFAEFASSTIQNRFRLTHYRDVVPHLPWTERFVHISGEWYEDQYGKLHSCEGYEDEDCADQWYYLTIEDHLYYLGLNITNCAAVT